uniref:Uncharacterized protein n=1 Tax=Parascaris univalens TaxID=6257 RepID=A0A915BKX2_PARUN
GNYFPNLSSSGANVGAADCSVIAYSKFSSNVICVCVYTVDWKDPFVSCTCGSHFVNLYERNKPNLFYRQFPSDTKVDNRTRSEILMKAPSKMLSCISSRRLSLVRL